jgi:hypothetical protein
MIQRRLSWMQLLPMADENTLAADLAHEPIPPEHGER